jgi:putative DNA methylase
MPRTEVTVSAQDARRTLTDSDVFITDPPYADAVNYHEITEFFIAWLRKNPPPPFDQWTWDSSRAHAIKGQGAHFRRSMVEAYAAMTRHMADTGLQIVMFTHQDAGVWADLAGIMWAAGLRVTAAWNIVTETDSALRSGNYVQGTVCLVLRKRGAGGNANQMNIEGEIADAVKAQLAALGALDTGWTTATRGETLYTDGDLTLAAYAAALTIVTRYATIDRRDVGADVFRELKKGEKTRLRLLIDYAASVANRELVPRDFAHGSWRDLDPASRFYVRMLDMEDRGAPKVADFQNFAKSFALADYTRLMSSTQANAASLAGAAHRKGLWTRDEDLKTRPLFQLLFALWRTLDKGDPKLGLTHLQSELFDFWTHQRTLSELARYVALKTRRTRPEESRWADELAQTIDAARLWRPHAIARDSDRSAPCWRIGSQARAATTGSRAISAPRCSRWWATRSKASARCAWCATASWTPPT